MTTTTPTPATRPSAAEPGATQPSRLAGSVSWFEVGSPDPSAAREFYGSLFGWTFTTQDVGMPYTSITTGSGHPIGGGIADTGGRAPAYAAFCIVVDDVAATLERATELGGSVVIGPLPLDTGMVVGYLRDRDDNLLAVYSPVPGQES